MIHMIMVCLYAQDEVSSVALATSYSPTLHAAPPAEEESPNRGQLPASSRSFDVSSLSPLETPPRQASISLIAHNNRGGTHPTDPETSSIILTPPAASPPGLNSSRRSTPPPVTIEDVAGRGRTALQKDNSSSPTNPSGSSLPSSSTLAAVSLTAFMEGDTVLFPQIENIIHDHVKDIVINLHGLIEKIDEKARGLGIEIPSGIGNLVMFYLHLEHGDAGLERLISHFKRLLGDFKGFLDFVAERKDITKLSAQVTIGENFPSPSPSPTPPPIPLADFITALLAYSESSPLTTPRGTQTPFDPQSVLDSIKFNPKDMPDPKRPGSDWIETEESLAHKIFDAIPEGPHKIKHFDRVLVHVFSMERAVLLSEIVQVDAL